MTELFQRKRERIALSKGPPSTTKELLDMFQDYGILPSERDGRTLYPIDTNKRRGDKLNEGYTLSTRGRDQIFVSARPTLE